mgnify:CR=1 FL=1
MAERLPPFLLNKGKQMWILPKNYPLSSHYVADMVASKEDLSLPDLNIESSLLVKSKPSPLRTWLTRWKPTSYLPHLFTRILKPCQWNAFETEFTSLHLAIPVSLLVQRENGQEKTIPDTSGLTSKKSSEQFDLFDASSRMLKDTSVSDCEKSLATWKALVTSARGEYSARLKSAHLTKESESLSWPTPTATNNGPGVDKNNPRGIQQGNALATAVLWESKGWWPTPSAHEARLGYQDRSDPTKKGTQESLLTVVVNTAGGRLECPGQLNPEWVEWLMGVPTGWTELGSWGTESCQQQPPKRG